MATLDEDVIADVLRLFLNEGLIVAGAKPKQGVLATDTKRWVIVNAAGTALEFGASDDTLQCLLAGPQVLTGAKTFDGGAIVNNSFTANVLGLMNSLRLTQSMSNSSGGIDQISAPNIDTADATWLDLTPTTTNSFFNINVAPKGKFLLVRNIDSSTTITLGTTTGIFNGGLFIAGSQTVFLISFGGVWFHLGGTAIPGVVNAAAGGANPGAATQVDVSNINEVILNPFSGTAYYDFINKINGQTLTISVAQSFDAIVDHGVTKNIFLEHTAGNKAAIVTWSASFNGWRGVAGPEVPTAP